MHAGPKRYVPKDATKAFVEVQQRLREVGSQKNMFTHQMDVCRVPWLKSKPAHAFSKAVAVGHGHTLHQLQLCKRLSMLVGHILIHRQPALYALDLALLNADLLELVEHILSHAVLQQQMVYGQ